MPGPVSDAYDPEFGTATAAAEFRDNVWKLHKMVGDIIKSPPVHFTNLPHLAPGPSVKAELCERDWRFIRYALESLADSI